MRVVCAPIDATDFIPKLLVHRIKLRLEMYAVFTNGSHQYRVSEGDEINVDFADLEPGAKMEFPDVLLVADGTNVQIGRPLVAGVKVTADVVEETARRALSPPQELPPR
jgi:ribosomal protein L21